MSLVAQTAHVRSTAVWLEVNLMAKDLLLAGGAVPLFMKCVPRVAGGFRGLS